MCLPECWLNGKTKAADPEESLWPQFDFARSQRKFCRHLDDSRLQSTAGGVRNGNPINRRARPIPERGGFFLIAAGLSIQLVKSPFRLVVHARVITGRFVVELICCCPTLSVFSRCCLFIRRLKHGAKINLVLSRKSNSQIGKCGLLLRVLFVQFVDFK